MKSIETLWHRAERYLQDNQVHPARAMLEAILARDANQPRAHLVLGGIAWKQDRIRLSIEHGLAASRCELTAPEIVCDVIAALIQVGESAAAGRMFEHPLLEQGTLSVSVLMRLSGQAQANGEHVRALALLERAQRAGASGADFLSYLGVQLAFNGRIDDAERELEACVRLDPTAGRAGLILSRLRKQTRQHNHLENLRVGLARVRRGGEEHASLEFARYKECEDLEHYEEAWDALSNANRVMRDLLRHDTDAEARCVERLIEVTSGWAPTVQASVCEGPTPIFIVGMPRSGTTLLDRMLGNHSRVANAGELGDFGRQLRWAVDHCTPLAPDAVALDKLEDIDFAKLGQRYLQQTQWRAGDKSFYIDKLPANWMVSGLIARALPTAPILHMVRGPMDVCFSNWRAMFGDSYPYSYDLTALARHHDAYRKVMAHWRCIFPQRLLGVAYRDLIENSESTLRHVFAFCGLEPEAGCADVTRNARQLATLSMVQAREPIHTRGIGHWRPYAGKLKALQAALAGQ